MKDERDTETDAPVRLRLGSAETPRGCFWDRVTGALLGLGPFEEDFVIGPDK